jgi:hypothetical protein
MSTDYSKMSDIEVAQKVFFWLSNDFCQNGGLAHINNDGFFFFDNGNLSVNLTHATTQQMHGRLLLIMAFLWNVLW